MKRLFLVNHSYGTGGFWAVVSARSAAEIREKFPFVEVLEGIPRWMSEEYYNSIGETDSYDIDEESKGWLKRMSGDPPPP